VSLEDNYARSPVIFVIKFGQLMTLLSAGKAGDA